MAAYFNERVETLVVPNVINLIDLFRSHDRKIIYTRNGSTTTTADQVTPRLKRKRRGNPAYNRSSPGNDVDPRLAPTCQDLAWTSSPRVRLPRRGGTIRFATWKSAAWSSPV